MKKLLVYLFLPMFLITITTAGKAQIIGISDLSSSSPQLPQINSQTYELIELGLSLSPSIETGVQNGTINPFNPNEVEIWAELKDAVSGRVEKTIYGFYMVEYDTDPYNQATTPASTQQNNWRLRFVVEESKQYTIDIYCNSTVGGGPHLYTSQAITINGTASSNNGYLRFPKGKKYMEFTNGTPFFAIGETIPPFGNKVANSWDKALNNGQTGTSYPSIVVQGLTSVIDELSSAGGNFLKYYFAPESIAIEWPSLGDYSTYQNRAHDLDIIFNELEANDVYLQLGLMTWEQYNSDPQFGIEYPISWSHSPYLNIPGVGHPVDMFYDANSCQLNYNALEYVKRKIRYCIARWGYSPKLASLEIMTELDRIGSYDPNKGYWAPLSICGKPNYAKAINEAAVYLGSYIKTLCPRMLVTTGTAAYYGTAVEFFDSDVCDYVDFHNYNSTYINGGSIEAYISEHIKRTYEKPFHSGECGTGANDCWIQAAGGNDGSTDFSNIAWSSSFSGAFGNAMYFDAIGHLHAPQWGLTDYLKFQPISAFFAGEDMNSEQYVAIKNKSEGTLALTCNTPSTIDDQPECRVGTGNTPTNLPHTTLQAYNSNLDAINGLDPAASAQILTTDDTHIEVYALRSGKKVLGWVHNKENYTYNLPHHVDDKSSYINYYIHPVSSGVAPSPKHNQTSTYVNPITDQSMTIKGLICSGSYRIDWYDTKGTGGIIPQYSVTNLQPNSNGELTVDIPDLVAVDPNTPDVLPDYGFKITMTQNNGTEITSTWKTDYVNSSSSPIDHISPSMAFTPNNKIYYVGGDGDLHCYYYDEHCWEETDVPLWGGNDKPDVQNINDIATTADNKVFYKNLIGKIEQVFEVPTSNNIPQWSTHMHTSAPSVLGSTIKELNGSIFYVSTNGYIVELYWDGSNWSHREVNWAPQVSISHDYLSSFTLLPNDRQLFYRNINGKLQQIYWSSSTNTWVTYTHSSAPDVAQNSEIKTTSDGRVVYETTNGYIAILSYNSSTSQWSAQEINWIPQTWPGDTYIAINSSDQIFYKNINGNLQEIYWGNYQGTYQWIGYTIGVTSVGFGKILSNSSNQMFYLSFSGDLEQVYYDQNTSTWVKYIHSNISPSNADGMLYIDEYDKVYYADINQNVKLLWWDKPCGNYTPCTFNNYKPEKTLVYKESISEKSLQVKQKPYSQEGVLNNSNIVITVSPNPTSGKFYIHTVEDNVKVTISNVQGQVLLSKEVRGPKKELDLSGYPNGIYILKYESSTRRETLKIRVSR